MNEIVYYKDTIKHFSKDDSEEIFKQLDAVVEKLGCDQREVYGFYFKYYEAYEHENKPGLIDAVEKAIRQRIIYGLVTMRKEVT